MPTLAPGSPNAPGKTGRHARRRFLAGLAVQPNRPGNDWVVTFDNTYYESARILVLGDDGLVRQFETGANTGTNDMPRGTAAVTLSPSHHYVVVVHVTSKFFTAMPRIDVQTRAQYHKRQRTNRH